MLHLEHDQLKFTFPEIAPQLRALLEQHLRQVSDKFRLPQDRTKLGEAIIREVELGWRFRLRHGTYESVYLAAQSLTEDDVEEALRESAYEVARVHDDSLATVQITFQRTLRIPDDGKMYPLPAGFGRFPLRAVDDFAATAPPSWLKRGGVVMPMYQSEALWIDFSSSYPFAVKVAAGKINAVSGEPWSPDLQQEPQNYLVLPDQPWLDGFAVGEGVIRQFVAMPLGAGYSVEEQLTGQAVTGGIQLQAYPIRAESYFRDEVIPSLPSSLDQLLPRLFAAHLEENLPCRAPRMAAAMDSDLSSKKWRGL
jgi:hypothetical protein